MSQIIRQKPVADPRAKADEKGLALTNALALALLIEANGGVMTIPAYELDRIAAETDGINVTVSDSAAVGQKFVILRLVPKQNLVQTIQ